MSRIGADKVLSVAQPKVSPYTTKLIQVLQKAQQEGSDDTFSTAIVEAAQPLGFISSSVLADDELDISSMLEKRTVDEMRQFLRPFLFQFCFDDLIAFDSHVAHQAELDKASSRLAKQKKLADKVQETELVKATENIALLAMVKAAETATANLNSGQGEVFLNSITVDPPVSPPSIDDSSSVVGGLGIDDPSSVVGGLGIDDPSSVVGGLHIDDPSSVVGGLHIDDPPPITDNSSEEVVVAQLTPRELTERCFRFRPEIPGPLRFSSTGKYGWVLTGQTFKTGPATAETVVCSAIGREEGCWTVGDRATLGLVVGLYYIGATYRAAVLKNGSLSHKPISSLVVGSATRHMEGLLEDGQKMFAEWISTSMFDPNGRKNRRAAAPAKKAAVEPPIIQEESSSSSSSDMESATQKVRSAAPRPIIQTNANELAALEQSKQRKALALKEQELLEREERVMRQEKDQGGAPRLKKKKKEKKEKKERKEKKRERGRSESHLQESSELPKLPAHVADNRHFRTALLYEQQRQADQMQRLHNLQHANLHLEFQKEDLQSQILQNQTRNRNKSKRSKH